MSEEKKEWVNHPRHYNLHPSGVEAIDIMEWLPANLACALKHIWRRGNKDAARQDLEKARWYLNREIERATKHGIFDCHAWRIDKMVSKVFNSEPSGSVLKVALVSMNMERDISVAGYCKSISVVVERVNEELNTLPEEK